MALKVFKGSIKMYLTNLVLKLFNQNYMYIERERDKINVAEY